MMKLKKNIKKQKGKFRFNVCAVIQKKGTELFLVGHRKGFPREKGWQFPQGGIDGQCDFLGEMRRELREEIGTDAVRVISISSNVYTYTFPPEYAKSHPGFIGQVQRWVLAEYEGSDTDISAAHEPAEFDGFRWARADDIVNEIVDFKRDVYVQAMTDLKLLS